MAAPSGIVWGSVVGSGTKQAKLGIYVKLTTTNTQVTREVQVWYATRYAVSDSSNTFKYDCSTTATSASTSKGSVSVSHSSNTSWSTSNQTKLATYTYTYTRGTSAVTYKIYASMSGIDYIGVTASANTSFTVPALAKYTVSYNANGGSGAPSSQTKYYGKTLTLSTTKPTRTGYTFSKWNTAAAGTGTSYAAGASYTANATATLYAQWTANTYTATVNQNGGYRVSDGTTGTVTFTKAYGATEAISERRREGYTLTGYVITNTSSGSTTDIGGATITFDSSTKTGTFTQGSVAVTLTAQWQINTYTVTFDGNGGTSSEASKTANYNTTISSLPTATKKNHNFVEWNTAADGSGTAFTTSTKVTANITVYAIYELAANCFVKNDGEYTAAMLYIMVDGIYKTGMLYVKDNGTYKQSGM